MSNQTTLTREKVLFDNRTSLLTFLLILGFSLIGGLIYNQRTHLNPTPEKLSPTAFRGPLILSVSQLKEKGHFKGAASLLEKILLGGMEELSAEKSFALGDLFQKTLDWEQALAFYQVALNLKPEEELKREIEKNQVVCLEKLSHFKQAGEIYKRASLDGNGKKPSGKTPWAKIEGKVLFQEDFENFLSLSGQGKIFNQVETNQKMDFFKSFLSREALFTKGKKLQIANTTEFKQKWDNLQKDLYINALIEQKIKEEVKNPADREDVKNYYHSHKENFGKLETFTLSIKTIDTATLEKLKGEEISLIEEIPGSNTTTLNLEKVENLEGLNLQNPQEFIQRVQKNRDFKGVFPYQNGSENFAIQIQKVIPESIPPFEEISSRVENHYLQEKQRGVIQKLTAESLQDPDNFIDENAFNEWLKKG